MIESTHFCATLYRTMIARRIVGTTSMVVFFAPLPVVMVRLGSVLKAHRQKFMPRDNPRPKLPGTDAAEDVELQVSPAESSADAVRYKEIKKAQWQVTIFAVAMFGLLVYVVNREVRDLNGTFP